MRADMTRSGAAFQECTNCGELKIPHNCAPLWPIITAARSSDRVLIVIAAEGTPRMDSEPRSVTTPRIAMTPMGGDVGAAVIIAGMARAGARIARWRFDSTVDEKIIAASSPSTAR